MDLNTVIQIMKEKAKIKGQYYKYGDGYQDAVNDFIYILSYYKFI